MMFLKQFRSNVSPLLPSAPSQSKPLQPNVGITLVELIASTVVASMVISVAFGGMMFNRELYAQDEVRTRVNQTLRSAMDLVGADAQQIGEQILRADPAFPAVELRRTPATPAPGSTDWSSSLIMRRNLLPFLTVCQNLGNPGDSEATPPVAPTSQTGITSIQIFTRDTNPNDEVRPEGTCGELSNERDNASAPAIDAVRDRWNTARTNNGGTLRAFLYDGNGGGQFVTVTGFTSPDANSRTVTIQSANGLQFYANGRARLYFLEERRYEVDTNRNLTLKIDDGTPQTVVSGVERFQVRITTNPVVSTDPLINHFAFCEYSQADRCLNPDTSISADARLDSWSVINHLRVTLIARDTTAENGRIDPKSQESARTISEDFFPRNVMNFN
jgi:type II secretory pathway pseudopilin PulG